MGGGFFHLFDNFCVAVAIIFATFSSLDGSYILHLVKPLHISGFLIFASLKLYLKLAIILSSIVGDCSINLSYSARHTFKKSNAGLRLTGSNANSIDISLPNLDHDTSAKRCDSVNSAYRKKFCKVDKIPANIFTEPTHAIAICLFSSGTNESIAKFAVPVNVDKIITGIVNK